MISLLQIVIVGVIATLVLDACALILKHGLRQTTTNWGMVGRWFAYLPRGVMVHDPISRTEPVAYEKAIGWFAHYAVGIVYAWLYLFLVSDIFLTQPTLANAFVFGVLTVLAPWFILQPGLGLGMFARKSPKPNVTRFTNLSMHAIFGLGIYMGWSVFTKFF